MTHVSREVITGGASRRLGTTVPVAVAAAWTVALVAQTTGNAGLLRAHDHGADAGLPLWVVVLTFVLGDGGRVPGRVAGDGRGDDAAVEPADDAAVLARRGAPGAGRVGILLAFLGGYAVDVGARSARPRSPSTSPSIARVDAVAVARGANPWLIGAGTLALAGAFQFSPLKFRCLDQCHGPPRLRHSALGIPFIQPPHPPCASA